MKRCHSCDNWNPVNGPARQVANFGYCSAFNNHPHRHDGDECTAWQAVNTSEDQSNNMSASPWKTTEPPNDVWIVAVGAVVYSDESRGYNLAFTATIKRNSGIWVGEDGLALNAYQNERVVISYWLEAPASQEAK